MSGARRVAGLTLPPLKHLGPLLVVWGASMVLLVFIRDLGSSLMFFGAFLALIYVATGRISFVIIGLAHVRDRGVVLRPHVRTRPGAIRHLARPVPQGWELGGYQIAQSLFAQADGGLFGRGLGEALLSCQLSPACPGTSRTRARSCPRRTPTSSTR